MANSVSTNFGLLNTIQRQNRILFHILTEICLGSDLGLLCHLLSCDILQVTSLIFAFLVLKWRYIKEKSQGFTEVENLESTLHSS